MEHFKNLIRHNYQINDEALLNEYYNFGMDSIKSNQLLIDKNEDSDIKKSLTEEIFKKAIAKKWAISNTLNS